MLSLLHADNRGDGGGTRGRTASTQPEWAIGRELRKGGEMPGDREMGIVFSLRPVQPLEATRAISLPAHRKAQTSPS